MDSETWTGNIVRVIDPEGETVNPVRLVDYDVTTSFAHLTPNLTIDEVFGYRRLQKLEELCQDINILPQDYDGTLPSREKPRADLFETVFKKNCSGLNPRMLFEEDIPISMQSFERERILEEISKDWKRIILDTGLKDKVKRRLFGERFFSLVTAIRESAEYSQDAREFLASLRKRFLNLVGISMSGIPESRSNFLYAQKLEEDLEEGFPFWRVELPDKFRDKHMSNEAGTYLFYGVSYQKRLVKVRFYLNPERFEFEASPGERIVIPAEKSPHALSSGEIVATSTLLSYIVLSPARKPRDVKRKVRVHIGGNFMAGPNGYAWDLVPYVNRTPGFDEVRLVCTGYDGRSTVRTRDKEYISFGVVFPFFGKTGLVRSLEGETPTILEKSEICDDK